MYDLLIASSLILMLIGPAIFTAIQRATSDDLYLEDLHLSELPE